MRPPLFNGELMTFQDQTRSDSISVSTTAVNIMLANPRKVWYARNNSTGSQSITIFLSNAGVAVANYGIVLKPGDVVSDSTSEGYECYQGIASAISDGAGAVLGIFER